MMVRNNITPVNYTPGRNIYVNGVKTPVSVSGITIHTEQGYENGTVSWFKNPASYVSANYGVALDGTIDLIVDEGNTSWADGNFESNSRHITIELEDNNNPEHVDRTDPQYQSVAKLVADAARRYGFPIDRAHVKRHSEVSGSHPQCPGNVDVDYVVNLAHTYFEQLTAPIPAPAPDVLTEYHDWTGKVKIINATLNVRTAPTATAPGSQANTPDGQLHAGMIADVVGWGVGQDPYGDGRNKWYKSFRGKWFWAGGTDQANPNYGVAPATPVVVTPAPVVESPKVIEAPAPVVEPLTETPAVPAPGTVVQPEVAPVVEPTPAPVVEETVPAYSSSLVLFEEPADVIAPNGSAVIDINTGQPVANFVADKKITVVGYVEHEGEIYLQTENLARHMQNHGLPRNDFELYVPKGKLDGIQPPSPQAPAPAAPITPTYEETISNTNNKLVRGLLRVFHHTNK